MITTSAHPSLSLNCPLCAHPLDYVLTVAAGQIYVCDFHGEFQLARDGRLRGGTGPYGRHMSSAAH